MLWFEAPCGIKQPLMRWSSLEEVKTFGESILDFYKHRQTMMREADGKEAEGESSVADRLLREVFRDNHGCSGEVG
jgi:hypothetical protein